MRYISFLIATLVCAQDERRVTSPNGQIEFRLFIARQGNSDLSRIAYEVFLKGKLFIQRSFLGLDIQDQEPLLGENVGLTSFSYARSGKYNSLIAKYMQNGSLGRLINIEARAYDDGVAFRYVIPPSTPLMQILIAEEATEFRFAAKVPPAPIPSDELTMNDYPSLVKDGAGWFVPLSESDPKPVAVFSFGETWVALAESKLGTYAPIRLIRPDQTTYLSRLARSKPIFEGKSPVSSPWRIISIAHSPESVIKSQIVRDLNR